MFALSFGKDNRFLTFVSVRLKYLWSSIKAVPRQLTLRYRFFTICHFLVISCGFSWPLTVPLAVSASMGAYQDTRNSLLLSVLHGMLIAMGIVCSVNTVTKREEKAALKSFRKYSSGLDVWKLAKAVGVALVLLVAAVSRCSCGCWALVPGCCRGMHRLALAVCGREAPGSLSAPLLALSLTWERGEAVCSSERWKPIGVVSLESLQAPNNLN